ncbi:MAG: GFA family protein [Boseongicola sp.]|nr:GFA family protein [Boseongicola sp.]MDD9979479.1 GFA family protein [Boseongicola sp.]
MSDKKTGRCLCGAVRYTVSGPLRPVIACHCKQCQRTSGFHVAATSAARGDIEITGRVTWYESSDTARRGFCGTCGSNLFWDGAGDNLSIFAGTLDAPTGLAIKGHIYCADKGDYYELTDDLPKAPGRDPELTTMVR